MSILSRLNVLPIRHKILFSIIGTSLIVVVISTTVYLVIGWVNLKNKANSELETTANIFAQNISAALSFGDAAAANELLLSLGAMKQIDLACVYDAANNGALFASYRNQSTSKNCPANVAKVPTEQPGTLIYGEPVYVVSDRVGMVYLCRSTADLKDAMGLSVLVGLGMVAISFLIAFVLTGFFRELIEQPIKSLVATTRRVSNEGDFAVRADKFADDSTRISQKAAD